MVKELVWLKDLAIDLGMDRSRCRRYVLSLGIEPHKRRDSAAGNVLALSLTKDEAEHVRNARKSQGYGDEQRQVSAGAGSVYIIRLVPELDPRRIKIGFADDLKARLLQHRTAAPTAVVVKSWPAKRTWEGPAMDCLTATGCRLILNEVFECDDVDALLIRGDAWFALMPDPEARLPLAETSPQNT